MLCEISQSLQKQTYHGGILCAITKKTLHKKWSFPLRISSVNVTKFTVLCSERLHHKYFLKCSTVFNWFYKIDFYICFLQMGQSIQEWTKWNFLKSVFHKFYLVHSWILSYRSSKCLEGKAGLPQKFKNKIPWLFSDFS